MNYDNYRGVLNADLFSGALVSGWLEIPIISRTQSVPSRLIAFDKAISSQDTNQWVHFFIHDHRFIRLWRNPWRYLPVLARFQGVIAPDFSIFWDLPLYKQIESICRSREIGSWLQRNGIDVIPCIRWGKKETYEFAFQGVESGGTVAVGTSGCMREKEIRLVFEEGFSPMLEAINPKRIVVYGSVKDPIFTQAATAGIEIIDFPTSTSIVYSERKVR